MKNIKLKSPNDRLPIGNYEWAATIVYGKFLNGSPVEKRCTGTYASPPFGTLGDFLDWLGAEYARLYGARFNIGIRDYKLRMK